MSRLDLYRHHVKQPKDAPKGPHFAIILFKTESVWIPGDERSRTNPGHGYPEHTDTFNTSDYYAFLERATWEKAIHDLYLEKQDRTDVLAFEVAGVASPTVQVTVRLGPP